MKHIQNNQKPQKIHTSLWILKIHTSLWILKISRKKSANQKFGNFCLMFVIFKRKITPEVMDINIYRNV